MVTEFKLLIGGEWVDASDGKTFDSINPANEEAHARIASATRDDVERAVAAARKAVDEGPWGSKISGHKRSKILTKIGDLINQNKDELAALETRDTGKPLGESKNIDVTLAAEEFYYFAGAASKLQGATIPTAGRFLAYTMRQPVGVVALIVPWNFPLLILARKTAAALAAGNAVIIKPASETPTTALKLGELCKAAGVPDGVVNVLPGRGSVVGPALVNHSGVDAISFTGSTEVGQDLIRNSATTCKKLSLELGGKSPNIVFADADLDTASKYALAAIFYNAGEVCTAGSRLLVEEACYDEFMEKLVTRAKKMAYGDPMDEKTRLGPLSSKGHRDTVHSFVEAGKKEGARLLVGGEMPGGKGYYYPPTIFDGVTESMKIAREEIFGPVLATMKFSDVDDAVRKANDCQFGLASGVWTQNIKKAHAVAARLNAGTVWINTYNMYDPAVPYGGYKMSGYGKDSGLESLNFYLKTKSVWVDLS